jgi:K+ transporter
VAGFFLCIDAVFGTANLVKIMGGGWALLIFAATVYTIRERLDAVEKDLPGLLEDIQKYLES